MAHLARIRAYQPRLVAVVARSRILRLLQFGACSHFALTIPYQHGHSGCKEVGDKTINFQTGSCLTQW